MKARQYRAYFQGEANLNGQRNVVAEVGRTWVWITVSGRSRRRKISRQVWDLNIAPSAREIEGAAMAFGPLLEEDSSPPARPQKGDSEG